MNALKLPKKPKTKLIQAEIDEDLVREFLDAVRARGVFQKQAIEYGLRAFIEATKTESEK